MPGKVSIIAFTTPLFKNLHLFIMGVVVLRAVLIAYRSVAAFQGTLNNKAAEVEVTSYLSSAVCQHSLGSSSSCCISNDSFRCSRCVRLSLGCSLTLDQQIEATIQKLRSLAQRMAEERKLHSFDKAR